MRPLARALVALSLLTAAFGARDARAQAQLNPCEEPNVLIVLDRSGSMLEDGKWNQAVNAITQLTRTFEFRIRFGLMVFPNSGDCGVTLPGAVLAPVAALNGPAIESELNGRAYPNRGNNTPIGQSLNRAAQYYQDLNDQGRRSFVVLVTDGMETCNGNGQNAARDAFNAGLPVFVIGFGRGVDNRALNNMAAAGGTNQAYQANSAPELFEALEAIANAAGEETCDARDNDCDGQVDEGLPDQPCSTACGDGRQICVDGTLSECFGGGIPTESCDSLDNDCDGRVDEVDGVPCTTSSGNAGTAACVGGSVSMDCIPDDPNREEVCDAFDNDMDGRVDENTDEPCSNQCHQGRRLCIEGSYLRCTALEVTDELCDGEDNDCDGLVDESARCVGAEVCGEEGTCLSPCSSNECPTGFVCDVADNLCHPLPCEPGCAAGQRCLSQTCVTPCAVERDCGQGEICTNRLCTPGSSGAGGAGGGAGGFGGSGGGAGGFGGVDGQLDAGNFGGAGGSGGEGATGADSLPAEGGCSCNSLDEKGKVPAAPTLALGLALLALGTRRRR